jgi:hypothetical protein
MFDSDEGRHISSRRGSREDVSATPLFGDRTDYVSSDGTNWFPPPSHESILDEALIL